MVEKIKIKTEYITLGQFLKIIDLISSGGEAKIFLLTNDILVNNQKETRRGRKLIIGDEITVLDKKYIIC